MRNDARFVILAVSISSPEARHSLQTDGPKGKIDAYIFNNPSLMVLCGTFLGGGFVLSLGTEISAETREYLLYALTAIITLFASAIALFGTFRLINHQKEIEAENRRRKLDAARASLPQALSDVVHSLTEYSQFYRELLHWVIEADEGLAKLTEIGISQETRTTLERCIEHSEESASLWLSLLNGNLQLISTRAKKAITNDDYIATEIDVLEGIALCAEAAAICSLLFDFARVGRAPKSEMARDDLGSSSDLYMIGQDDTRELTELLRYKRQKYDETGGWSAQAFRNRLSLPSHYPLPHPPASPKLSS
ncbi:MAG: hypothetical protein JJ872_11205 [Marivivens sp.]|nr:hypothetical protein [Marivivens sp.]